MNLHQPDHSGDLHPLHAELVDLIGRDPKMFEFIQQGSLDGIWYWNLENPEQEWMSPELWELFGVDPASKRHDPAEWQDIIFPEDLALAIENFEKHCKDPSHPYDQTVRYRHVDGSTVWVRCRGIAIRDENGRAIRMLGAHNDLTAIKRAEEAALQRARKLKIANDELKSFAYGVSHDLKAPSRTALQLIQESLLCEDGQLSDDQRHLLDAACQTLVRMQSLIDDLLDYGRVVELDMVWERVSLDRIVSDAILDLQSEIARADAEFELDPLPAVMGSPAQLRMLLLNLISNAVKFNRPKVKPKINITGGKTPEGKPWFQITDNGCGIPASHADTVFNVFTRLHRHEDVPGTGLGLALCKRIVLNHHGEIELTSTPGVGSTFEITFSR